MSRKVRDSKHYQKYYDDMKQVNPMNKLKAPSGFAPRHQFDSMLKEENGVALPTKRRLDDVLHMPRIQNPVMRRVDALSAQMFPKKPPGIVPPQF